jgi:Flp pilus assembly protein TadG
MKRLRGLLRDVEAATAVEFAMLVTPFVALVLASLQLSIMFYAGQVLQSATMIAGRQLMTGSDQQAGFTQSKFHTAVCNDANFLFSCGDLMVDVQSASSYSTLNTSPISLTYNAQGNVTNTWSYSPGAAGDIVIVRVLYNWPVVGGPLALGLANQPNGNHLLVGTSVFKNEPY